jgi:hypothetical protein
MKQNNERPIAFSDKYLQAKWLSNAENIYLENRTIVVNLGNEKACISAPPEKYLNPRTSTILKEVSIKSADSMLLIQITDETNIGGIVLDPQWHQLGEISDFPKDVPLWKSPQYDLGTVRFDPYFVTGLSGHAQDSKLKTYQVKVNLWFAPGKTNCAIHNHHMVPEFLEVHTQIYGIGRMQKFHANNFATLYQDVILSPGDTHIPFASVDESGAFIYPWHQYYSDTDCIWMANEFHPLD